ncbi:hypothetical protein BH10PSE6_BH10PSE6_42220 [soil metagenome]
MAKSRSELSRRGAMRMLGGTGGYGEILAAIGKITTPATVTKIRGENWFRVLDSARG